MEEGSRAGIGRGWACKVGKAVMCPQVSLGESTQSDHVGVLYSACRACGMFQALWETDLCSSSGCRSY